MIMRVIMYLARPFIDKGYQSKASGSGYQSNRESMKNDYRLS